MAASIGMCRLHMRGRGSLSKCFQTIDMCLQRNVGTNVAAAQSGALKKEETEQKDGYKSFYAVQAERQEQAERSVLISCHSKTNEKKILKYLSRHGDIKKCFFYESYGTYAVVEFANQESLASLYEGTSIPSINHESVVPFKSRLLSLRSLGPADPPNNQSGPQCQPQTTIPIHQLIQRLSREDSIDQQVTSLTEAYQLTEENTCLRFLVCSLLKDIAAAYFPECTIRPFGSSVNGFGKLGCDLDMFLDLDSISGRNIKRKWFPTLNPLPFSTSFTVGRYLGDLIMIFVVSAASAFMQEALIYHRQTQPKAGLSLEYQMKRVNSERAVTQSILSVIGECVDQFGPGCVGVQKILNARCPLVRFAHQPSGFQCDLTANNRVAMKSTELLYLYGALDRRVRCLVFAVRCWARAHGITSSIPGAWISNFSLTVMVLFFLQRRSTPVIPTLDHLQGLAGPADKTVIEGNDCTFVSDFSQIRLQSNTETLEQLLHEFFDFYGTFAFSRMSINIRKGKEQNKPEVAPLHIQNPFEPSLNVSKNVNVTQLDRFVALCQESSWLLQQSETNAPGAGAGKAAPTPWGLAALLLPSQAAGVKGRKKRKREPASERIKSLLDSLKKNNGQKKSQDSQ